MSASPLAPAERLVITGCGVLSSVGSGSAALGAALRDGRSGRAALAGHFDEPLPFTDACWIADFDLRQLLGKKGTSFFDRLTGLTIATCGMALESARLAVDVHASDRIGVVLGSSVGSMRSISEFTRQSLVSERPYLVNPVLFPNTVMNCAAGQAAIWYKLRAVNATVSNGQLSSLAALRYAMWMLRRGYADVLVVGGAEEMSPQLAWGFHHASDLAATPTLLGEGCALFVLEPARTAQAEGRTALLELLACEVGCAAPPGDPEAVTEALARCIRRGLARARLAGGAWVHAGSFRGDPLLDPAEAAGVALGLGDTPSAQPRVKQAAGECYSAAGALQLAALADQLARPGSAGLGLVTSVGRDGSVGCAIVRQGFQA